MRKIMSAWMLILVFVFVVGCSSNQASDSEATTDDTSTNDSSNSEDTSSEEASSDSPSYPERTIEMVIPYSPGGQTDTSARVVAQYMSEILGEEIVVVNQTSGGGAVAIDSVMNADSDGYRLFYGHQAMFTAYATGQLEVNVPDELKPIGTYAAGNQAYVVSADAPWNSMEEFVEDAKNNPGEYKYGADIGGTTHFMGAMLTQAADIDLNIVDAGGESERMTALLGGQVDVVVTSIGNAVNYVESGDYKVLGTLTEERDPTAPDFPTSKEQGYDIVFSVTHVLYGPKDLEESVVSVWNDATDELVANEEYQAKMKEINAEHVLKTSEETAEYVNKEFDYIQEIGAELGF